MSVRWCWMGSHEIPEGERMVMPPRESSQICITCSETERGRRLMQDRGVTYDGRGTSSLGKWQRIYAAMQHPNYLKKRFGG